MTHFFVVILFDTDKIARSEGITMDVKEFASIRDNWDGFWVERVGFKIFTVYYKGFHTRSSSISDAKVLLKDAYDEAIQRMEREAIAAGF